MRKTFKFFMCAAIVAAGFTACSSEEGTAPEITQGEDNYSSLIVRDSKPATYGTVDTDPAVTEENLASADNLKAFVYNSDVSGGLTPLEFTTGESEITFTGSSPNYNSNKFKLASGDKYFYILANQANVTGVGEKASRGLYELQTVSAGFSNYTSEKVAGTTSVYRVNPIPANIATDNKFMIGTLWGKATTVPSGGTETTPKDITGLTIGRLAAKINLTEVTAGSATPLGGTFSDATYRLCSVPDAMYLVGQWDGTNEPGTNTSAALVKSIYHDEAAGTAGSPNTKFKNYKWTGAYAPGKAYYAVENTTALQNGDQYYGNTTYIQLKIKYTPTATIYKADGTSGGTLSNGTFWVYNVNGQPRIFAAEPSQSIAGISTTGTKYDKGFMYYSFPVADNSETEAVKKHAVLRNHSYLVKVTEIKNFGSGEESEVIPETPISTETWVTLEVSVLDWSKIEQDVPL
ncbi:sorbitol-specific phosphotransferase system component IIA [Parabacteroides sp. PF5-5]|uniref:Mfa1 family fimbria major subunit n=1 Tax=unclassified Parabacteroides TaxID=2649774 RepID=UPI0024733480|nr:MULTISPECIES: Mfa1 family fimbria major subunit [unclassified Parabacteroides]MDH6316887.1 sorbitol-specific phosphotransferase system component IIA [Parabacteroides sp. PF5-13]MDH6328072.1 sorbitol-specific phosphotransferase system component IIA [Parabacteroides sp. PH5-41]MDH6335920.1 sorbitol-specific phosphotransferase system component IIA [Parabacteroides sp. PF5-5]MDH6346938.1 sorbitol-specific phosphotransferase system component IIA [Parabacteroides sp. PH5-46]MDH6361900.1 sorbitol-